MATQQYSLDRDQYGRLVTEVQEERKRQIAEINDHFLNWRDAVHGLIEGGKSPSPDIERRVQDAVQSAIQTSRKQYDDLLNLIDQRYQESLLILRSKRLGGVMEDVQRGGNGAVELTLDEIQELLVPALRRQPAAEVDIEALVHPPSHAFVELAEDAPVRGNRKLVWSAISQGYEPVTIQCLTDKLLSVRLREEKEQPTVPMDPKADLPIFSDNLPAQALEFRIKLPSYNDHEKLRLILQKENHGTVEDFRYSHKFENKEYPMTMRLPGVHVEDGKVWKPLTVVRAYFVKPELAKQLPAHAAVA